MLGGVLGGALILPQTVPFPLVTTFETAGTYKN